MTRKLYWGSGSFWCWRVQIALKEKGLEYEDKLISFSNQEHRSEEILALNPRGQVPTFVDGENIVNESGAACLYLEDAYPTSGTRLLPSDIKEKAKVLNTFFETSNLANALQGVIFMVMRNQTDNVQMLEEKKAALKKELGIWEGRLKGKKYLVGDSFTLADVSAFPFLATAVRFGLDLKKSGFPALAEYYELVSSRESIKKTWPPHWNDSKGSSILEGL
eukprot:TRINITY_DN94_c0_g1_i2.p1 TRINITY_DN94_c0_g1~~TRINITY_DN94_c0_g1_i2.p1  ORF type:complete len:220 (+),score=31.17 TRINITY_DN94_c0_g1_i2:55-714(+)